jgi:hypothetical protein
MKTSAALTATFVVLICCQHSLAQWSHAATPYDGAIHSLVEGVDGRLFAGVDSGGVLTSTDHGETRVALRIDSIVAPVLALARCGNSVLAGTGSDGIVVSSNDGKN